MDFMDFGIYAIIFGVIVGLIAVCCLFFRVVVPTDEVHIVQTGGQTISYGKDTGKRKLLFPMAVIRSVHWGSSF